MSTAWWPGAKRRDRALPGRARLLALRAASASPTWRATSGILFAALPGDDRPDPRLASLSTLAAEPLARLDRFFREGGTANLRQALRYAGTLLGRGR